MLAGRCLQSDLVTHSDLQAKGALGPVLSGTRVMLTDKRGSPPLWHSEFRKMQAGIELGRLNLTLTGGAFVTRDYRRRELRVWGLPKACEQMAASLRAVHEEMLSTQHAVHVLPAQFRAVLLLGLVPKIKDASGARSISLDPKARCLMVQGDDSVAKRAINFIATEVARASSVTDVVAAATGGNDNAVCPVCYCELEAPFRLSCGHEYCTECLQNWIRATGAAGAVMGFPLACLAEGCAENVATLDIKRAISQEGFQQLQHAAVDDYVNAHLNSFQYCITPGCGGLFSLGTSRLARCSNCAISICTSCKVEEHDGLTCGQYLVAAAPPDDLRNRVIEEILTLTCPRCRKAFLDFTGCFALVCNNCKCGFCGWCLEDCDDDAHPHVARCTQKPHGADIFFGTFVQFQTAQRGRQQRELDAFMSKLKPEDRERLRGALELELADLELKA